MSCSRLSKVAERDLLSILSWSHDNFGEQGRLRYEGLVTQAMIDLAANPARAGARNRPELGPGAMTYHLRYSRDRVSSSIGRVRKPRHFLIYRVLNDGTLEIARILHESMDLPRHLPPGDR